MGVVVYGLKGFGVGGVYLLIVLIDRIVKWFGKRDNFVFFGRLKLWGDGYYYWFIGD